MNNKITIVFDIRDKEAAKWLWETHLTGKPQYGLVAETLVWGDELERLEEEKIDDGRERSLLD